MQRSFTLWINLTLHCQERLGAMEYQNEIICMITTIIPTASKINYIELDHKLIDIGINSVSFVKLLMELEKYFDE